MGLRDDLEAALAEIERLKAVNQKLHDNAAREIARLNRKIDAMKGQKDGSHETHNARNRQRNLSTL